MLTGGDHVNRIAYTELESEALPAVTASTQIFANAPDGTKEILATFRTAGLTMRYDAGTATAGANGNDVAAGTWTLQCDKALALKIRAIQNGGTATGWLTYFGTKAASA